MRFAYADPPYMGKAKKHYGGEEVDQLALIRELDADFDGWALSCNATDLRYLLPTCPTRARTLAWVKANAALKKNVGLTYAWEAVILAPGRKRSHTDGFVNDWIRTAATVAGRVDGKTFVGAKPEPFSYWLFEAANLRAGDEFHDLFPGTGAVTRAWEKWSGQLKMRLAG